jgi:hypothetical protein
VKYVGFQDDGATIGADVRQPQLIKGDERIMPRTDVQRFLDEEKERQGRRQELIEQLLADRDAKMAEFDEQLALLGYQADVVAAPPAPAPRTRERNQRSCKKCLALGLADLARGHIERGHDNWLARQPRSVQDRVAAA